MIPLYRFVPNHIHVGNFKVCALAREVSAIPRVIMSHFNISCSRAD